MVVRAARRGALLGCSRVAVAAAAAAAATGDSNARLGGNPRAAAPPLDDPAAAYKRYIALICDRLP